LPWSLELLGRFTMEEGVALLGTHSLIDDQVSKHSDSERCRNVLLLHYPFDKLSMAVTRIYIALSVCQCHTGPDAV
jgi:hypothetical protein